MSDYYRLVTAACQHSLPAVVCAAAVFLLSACTDFKRAIGIEKTSPDEFAVEQRAPLTIPPDFDLRPPAPGAPRPQEVTPSQKARQVVDNAGPGDPGHQAPGTLNGPSAPNPDQNTGNLPGADQGLSGKLLQSADTGAAVEKRETTIVKGVY
jgi:hypothetical protein